jgi:hypothetical protein
MKVTPISRRTPEGERGFREGFFAGWRSALSYIEEGKSVEEVRASHQATSDLLDRLAKTGEVPYR